MIESFASKDAEQIFRGQISKNLPIEIQRTARRKMIYLDSAEDLRDLQAPPGNQLENSREIGLDSIAYGSMTNGEFALNGPQEKPKMLNLLIIIRERITYG